MRRTGNYFLIIALFLGLFVQNGWGQRGGSGPVEVEATISKSTVRVGERISLTVEISGKDFNNISRPSIPNIEGFRLVSNTPSTSRSYRFVNGKSSVSYSYTYYLVAEQPGRHNIPPISLKIDGSTNHTGPIAVTVQKAANSGNNNNNKSGEDDENREKIFLDMEVSTRSPVPGEQIIASVVLYFRDDIQVTSFQPVPGWKAEGFWKERLETDQPQTDVVVRGGIRYKKAVLTEYALFPTKSGTLTLSPYKVALAIRTRSSGRDPFSSFFGARQRRIELKTDPVNLKVDSLPPLENARYLGAVGEFEIHRSVNTTEARVGETIELTTRINGQGNIPLIGKPRYELPNSFETYAPKESSTIDKDGQAIKGYKTFTDVLIPRKTGTFTIPAVKVAYYNSSRQDYNVKFLPAVDIKVSRNATAYVGPQSGGIPIQPVTGSAQWKTPAQTMLLNQWWFWTALALPPLFLLVGYWQKQYREKLLTDRDFARAEKAWEQARKRLERTKTRAEEGNTKEVYSTLHQLITAFIGDKLSLSEAGLSDDDYIRELHDQKVDTKVIQSVRSLLDKCATIRYAPNPTGKDLRDDIQKTETLIKQLKKQL